MVALHRPIDDGTLKSAKCLVSIFGTYIQLVQRTTVTIYLVEVKFTQPVAIFELSVTTESKAQLFVILPILY